MHRDHEPAAARHTSMGEFVSVGCARNTAAKAATTRRLSRLFQPRFDSPLHLLSFLVIIRGEPPAKDGPITEDILVAGDLHTRLTLCWQTDASNLHRRI